MIFLYFLNLCVAVGLTMSPIWWSKKLLKLDWLNPVSLVTLCFLPVEIFKLLVGQYFREEGLMYPYFQFAVLMTNLQQCIGLALIYFAAHLKVTKQIPRMVPQLGFYPSQYFYWISKTFFVFYIFAFLILAIKTGGVLDWLLNIRDSYIAKRDGNGIYYATAINCLSLSYFFFGLANSGWRWFTFLSLFYFGGVYILGSKGFLLSFFSFYLVIIWRQQQIPVGRILIAMSPVIFAMMLMMFFSVDGSVDLVAVAQYFEYYPNAAKYYADYFSGGLPLFEGKIFFSSFWEYVPRELFSEKPYIYGILYIVDIYFPGGAESGNTPAIYGAVPQFADFGILGVIFFAMINLLPIFYFSGMHYALKKGAFLRISGLSGRDTIICILLFAPVFGVFLPMGLIFCLLFSVLFIMRLSTILAYLLKPIFNWKNFK